MVSGQHPQPCPSPQKPRSPRAAVSPWLPQPGGSLPGPEGCQGQLRVSPRIRPSPGCPPLSPGCPPRSSPARGVPLDPAQPGVSLPPLSRGVPPGSSPSRSGPSRAPPDFEPRSRPAPGLSPTDSRHPRAKVPPNAVKIPRTRGCRSAMLVRPHLPPVPYYGLGQKKMSNPFFRRFPTQSFAGSGQPARPSFGFGGAAGDGKDKFLLGFAGERGLGWETLPEPCETP